MIVLEETLPIKLHGNPNRKWDERFLEISRVVSSWSKDPSTKVGAIVVNQNRRILATGYNGYPAGIDDEMLDDRMSKYDKMIHAESNAIYNACNAGVSLNLSTVYVFGMYVCPECVKALAQVKIGRVVFQLGQSQNLEKWKNDFDLSRVLLHDLGIGYTQYLNTDELQKGIDSYK